MVEVVVNVGDEIEVEASLEFVGDEIVVEASLEFM